MLPMSRWSVFLVLASPCFCQAADVGYERLFETALDEFSDKCVKLATNLPAWALGDFIISSAGRFEMGDRRVVSFGDAFGKMHRFEMKEGEVCATYRIMGTGFYNESLKEDTIGPGLLFAETEPPRECPQAELKCKMENLMAPNDNTYVNTVQLGNHLVSLTDGPFGVELDRKTLEVIGKYKWEDQLFTRQIPYSSSAHPVRHPETGDTIDFVGTDNILTGKATINVFKLGDKDPRTRINVVDALDGTPPYMHSFGMTKQHIVLPHMPVKFDLSAVMLKKSLVDAFVEIPLKEPSEDNGFLIVPLNGSKPMSRMLPVDDRLYYTHTVNTFENATGIVIDLTTAPVNPFTRNLTVAAMVDKATRDSDPGALMLVKRFVLPWSSDASISTELLSDPHMATDFTTINPRFVGKQHCFFWGVRWFAVDRTSFASMAIAKHDLCGSEPGRWSRKHWYPSEPTFIPSTDASATEDQGLLVFTALNGETKMSYLIVLDAATMRTVSEVGPFPPIGFTIHGEFYAARLGFGATPAYV